jgi:hypothetical protein
MTLAEFLESTPPNVEKSIGDLASLRKTYNNTYMEMETPDIQLHCSSSVCNGVRIFRCISGAPTLEKGWKHIFVYYKCRNCETTAKTFALAARLLSDRSSEGIVKKFGELPAFGPHVPSRVITLIGPDRDLFLHGRTAENLGLGIGAFAYYRRVVENQKGRIIRQLGKAAKQLGVSPELLKRFEAAANETQFTKAIDDIRDALPESLKIRGHNPLTLLHPNLSDGLHEKTDAECLELATSIRVVLTELADRISQALKDEAELISAVTKLLQKETKPMDSDSNSSAKSSGDNSEGN